MSGFDQDQDDDEVPEWMDNCQRAFDANVAHAPDDMQRMLESMPKDVLADAVNKSREMGGKAFKNKARARA